MWEHSSLLDLLGKMPVGRLHRALGWHLKLSFHKEFRMILSKNRITEAGARTPKAGWRSGARVCLQSRQGANSHAGQARAGCSTEACSAAARAFLGLHRFSICFTCLFFWIIYFSICINRTPVWRLTPSLNNLEEINPFIFIEIM